MAGTHLFTWLHLSDIHIGHGGASHEADQRLVLGALRDDVARQIADGLPRPDVILVTGDIAFSGACVAKDEYERAAFWLGEIAKAAGVPLEAVYAVPGNHDVQRPVDRPLPHMLMLTGLRSGAVTVDDALVDGATRAHLATRQANYLAFVEHLAPACRADAAKKEPRLYWRHRLSARGGLKVRIVGLNTALLSADEKAFGADSRALRLGKRQLADALAEPVGQHEVVIVLTHHPFSEGWLHDETDADTWIRNHAHIHLSGHVHKAENHRTRSGAGGDFVRIAAGAVHGEADPSRPPSHGYSFGAIMEENGALLVRLWPRKWSQDNAAFRRDVDIVNEATGFATHRLPRVAMPLPSPVREPETKPPSGLSRAAQAKTTPLLGKLEMLLNPARRTYQFRYLNSLLGIDITYLGGVLLLMGTIGLTVRAVRSVDPRGDGDAGVHANICGDTGTDPLHCGRCGHACFVRPHANATCTGGVCGFACDAGFGNCDGDAANGCETRLDSTANCGACGRVCTGQEVCVGGVCAVPCDGGLFECSGRCRDVQSDPNHCGWCGHVCSFDNASAVCRAGVCERDQCRPGFGDCDDDRRNGCEARYATDARNCGSCGRRCAAHEQCQRGECLRSCPDGFTDCIGTCRDLQTDSTNCGMCGWGCPSGQSCSGGRCVCAAPWMVCRGTCVDTQSDYRNCGACSHMCMDGRDCQSGRCACPRGSTACGRECVNLATNDAHCGACGNACGDRQECIAGRCAQICAPGLARCGDACINVSTDVHNCGECGRTCGGAPNVVVGCVAGVCVTRCNPGFANCDGSGVNGCEIDTQTNVDHCGACGRACRAGLSCVGGTCACAAGQTACGDRCVSLATDVSNCGACGRACAVGQTCVTGACIR